VRTAAGRRLFTFRRGLGAERVALIWLVLKGYRPVARRFSASGGEIDLVVRRGRTVAFVEVKTRGRLDDALASIDRAKRRRIGRAARAWLSRNPWAAAFTLRGDAVFVVPDTWPRHVEAAFELELGG
jgi:putative endonuclease